METDTKYSHFRGLGSTGVLLNRRVVRDMAYVLFEWSK